MMISDLLAHKNSDPLLEAISRRQGRSSRPPPPRIWLPARPFPRRLAGARHVSPARVRTLRRELLRSPGRRDPIRRRWLIRAADGYAMAFVTGKQRCGRHRMTAAAVPHLPAITIEETAMRAGRKRKRGARYVSGDRMKAVRQDEVAPRRARGAHARLRNVERSRLARCDGLALGPALALEHHHPGAGAMPAMISRSPCATISPHPAASARARTR